MRRLTTMTAACVLATALAAPAPAQERTDFRIAWSIYARWMPWGYISDNGIMEKWADRYGISVEIVQVNDYIESINQYTAGAFDGVSATNMDTLSIPAGGGVDTTALIVGDYSDGNDAIIVKGGISPADLAGRPVNLVELSVSHYLLARALDSVWLAERDLGAVINTADADMIAAFTTSDVEVVVAWNPLVSAILQEPDATLIFDSAGIPGEIIDMMMVNTATLAANPDFGKALVGAWYEANIVEIPGDGGGPSLKLVDVELRTEWQVGTASPSFGSRELSYLPFPGEMVTERTNMGFVYISLTVRRVRDLRDFLGQRMAGVESDFGH